MVEGTLLPLEKKPRILGITFDTMFTFAQHAENTAAKVNKRNNILKALAGTTWRQQKETLVSTYKALGRSVINYGAPVWTPNLKQSHVNKLQCAQNSALRIATGCHRMSAVDHLHQETEVIPVKQHNDLLTDQFYATCREPSHPCHELTTLNQPPRHMKETIKTYSGNRVQAAADSLPPTHDATSISKNLHTSTVSRTIASYSNNRVLATPPPPIASSEKSLPRKTRTRLAQLRSGWCSLLQSYQNRLNPGTPDTCPDCQTAGHTVQHLFQCPAHPVRLPTTALWTDPVKAAAELNI